MKRAMHTLYENAVVTFSRFIDTDPKLEAIDSIAVLSQLPVSIQKDVRKTLKSLWFQNTPAPEDPYTFEYRYLNLNSLDRKEFLMLINHPSEIIPEFVPYEMQTCHVNVDYYEFRLGNNSTILCRPCFEVSCSPSEMHNQYLFDYQTFWAERDWKFYNIRKHFEIDVSRLVDWLLKKETSWCDRCVFKPLFEYLDYSTCKQVTSSHGSDNSSDSDTSMVTTHNVTELWDPFHF